MEIKDNPLLQPEDYAKPYNENVEELKNNPALIEFDKLCFELFDRNEMGKRFIELVQERYVIPSIASRGSPSYQLDVLWGEGFKDFARLIMGSVKAHQQRILAGKH